jgi:hypothetical protein
MQALTTSPYSTNTPLLLQLNLSKQCAEQQHLHQTTAGHMHHA